MPADSAYSYADAVIFTGAAERNREIETDRDRQRQRQKGRKSQGGEREREELVQECITTR